MTSQPQLSRCCHFGGEAWWEVRDQKGRRRADFIIWSLLRVEECVEVNVQC